MTKEELAKILDGSEYPFKLWDEHKAKEHGLVVVYGASDDLMEFEGAINDEIGANNGVTVLVDMEGPIPSWEDVCNNEEEAGGYFRRKNGGKEITANWDTDGYSWTYTTDIPHATFDIMEDGETYCRGIVFSLADL